MKTYFSIAIAVLAIALLAGSAAAGDVVLLEAEGFDDLGGWKLDQQFMDQMGSPILLAHGMGVPVKDATTAVTFPTAGTYHLWVRTRDWVASFNAKGAPGKFQLLIDGKPVEKVFGTEGAKWHWQNGGTVKITKTKVTLSLHDLTGFDGRCDAIVFASDAEFVPPADLKTMTPWRRKLLGISEKPIDVGKFDLVVIGGGMAGCCTAVSAARLGCRVALIQNRPVLGGNNSSEVRVGLSGLIHQEPYRRLGDLVDEIGPVGHWTLRDAQKDPNSPRSKRILAEIAKHPEKKIHNAGPPTNYADQKKANVVRAEKNISLFLNTHANAVASDRKRITSLIAQNIRTGKRLRFSAPLFVDCTGDGNVGALAGADFRVGREAQSQTGEKLAPEQADQLVMGTSVQWYSAKQDKISPFPECPWAVQFNEKSCTKSTRGDWN
ncbi:MAG: FAD-dependent oxidoreductase, partial [Phycisphaerae bacterium]|nr:FAD-dependent oxidoreductase [Phycisphaerae bacterium]